MTSQGTRSTRAEEVRAGLDHPIVDGDGHFVEYLPELDRYLRTEGLADGLGGVMGTATFDGSTNRALLTPAERLAQRATRTPWYGLPTRNTRDLATATAPALLHERLGELGIDVAIVYPSIGLNFTAQLDPDVRRRACRALNRYVADHFAGLGDRLVPVASIPTFTPGEAVDELDHAVEELGLKAAVLAGFAVRPLEGGGPSATWVDPLGLDSVHDYDPLWARLVHHGVSGAFHSGSMGWSGRRSISNFTANHLGNFAGAGEATAKALFLGGITHRFPALRLAFLEGGVAWAARMLIDLVEHWHKRGPTGLAAYDPEALDPDVYDGLLGRYGRTIGAVPGFAHQLRKFLAEPEPANDFAAAGIESDEDVVARFTTPFSFGCEAEDPLASIAFDTSRLPLGASLRAFFSSDIGHWDVPEMAEVVPEVHEHLERGWMDAAQFRDFVCDNVVRFYTESNPAFFDGTAVEGYVREAGLAG